MARARAPPIASPVRGARSLVRYLQAATAARHAASRFPPAPRNPRVKGEVCFASPAARAVKRNPTSYVGVGRHDNYTCTTSASRRVRLSNRPLGGDLHFTTALQELELELGGVGAGPDRAINFPQSRSMDADVGRSAKSDDRNPRRVDRRPTAFIPQTENECTLFPRV